MKKKYYKVKLKSCLYGDKGVTVKARSPKQAILEALKKEYFYSDTLEKVVSCEEIDIFECVENKK